MKITLAIKRFNPQLKEEPYWQKYEATASPTARILDVLMDIKRNQDGSLSFRKSCAHGVCGSDAMLIDGKERLACKTLVKDVAVQEGAAIEIEPLQHEAVQRDLMVDQSVFFQKYRSVKPFLIAAQEATQKETRQSQQERSKFDDATKCILCSACYSACPVLDANTTFLGPAACVQAARFVYDSRDRGLGPRLEALDSPNGSWACQNHFECTRVCPRGIKITKLINMCKREIKKYREIRADRSPGDGTQNDRPPRLPDEQAPGGSK